MPGGCGSVSHARFRRHSKASRRESGVLQSIGRDLSKRHHLADGEHGCVALLVQHGTRGVVARDHESAPTGYVAFGACSTSRRHDRVCLAKRGRLKRASHTVALMTRLVCLRDLACFEMHHLRGQVILLVTAMRSIVCDKIGDVWTASSACVRPSARRRCPSQRPNEASVSMPPPEPRLRIAYCSTIAGAEKGELCAGGMTPSDVMRRCAPEGMQQHGR